MVPVEVALVSLAWRLKVNVYSPLERPWGIVNILLDESNEPSEDSTIPTISYSEDTVIVTQKFILIIFSIKIFLKMKH